MRTNLCRAILLIGLISFLPQEVTSSNPDSTLTEPITAAEDYREIRAIALLCLLPIIVSFSFVTFVLYRRKREAHFKQKETEFKLDLAETEVKALRAQINPHFIFNCMNSIHHFMHKNDIKNAGDYLIKFSQLIRLVLENSAQRTISLAEEITTLELYIQLEQLRLDHRFTYTIEVDPSINVEDCEVPPFLMQPFIENAIWHELSKVSENAALEINVVKEGPAIKYFIQSIGMGQIDPIQPPKKLTEGIKKTSMGLSLIERRIELLNRSQDQRSYYVLTDISEPTRGKFGHQVELHIANAVN